MLLDGPVAAMLCSPGRTLPVGDGWVLEPKWDGFRAIAQVTEAGPRQFTRHGRGHHHCFPAINAVLAQLPVVTVLDGKLACIQALADGRVRRAPHRPDANSLTVTLVVLDALAVGGVDLRAAPWADRRARLEELLGGAEGAVRLTPVLEFNPALHHALVADGWEGTVAKRTSGRYRCGKRSNASVKLKSPAARDRRSAALPRLARRVVPHTATSSDDATGPRPLGGVGGHFSARVRTDRLPPPRVPRTSTSCSPFYWLPVSHT